MTGECYSWAELHDLLEKYGWPPFLFVTHRQWEVIHGRAGRSSVTEHGQCLWLQRTAIYALEEDVDVDARQVRFEKDR